MTTINIWNLLLLTMQYGITEIVRLEWEYYIAFSTFTVYITVDTLSKKRKLHKMPLAKSKFFMPKLATPCRMHKFLWPWTLSVFVGLLIRNWTFPVIYNSLQGKMQYSITFVTVKCTCAQPPIHRSHVHPLYILYKKSGYWANIARKGLTGKSGSQKYSLQKH